MLIVSFEEGGAEHLSSQARQAKTAHPERMDVCMVDLHKERTGALNGFIQVGLGLFLLEASQIGGKHLETIGVEVTGTKRFTIGHGNTGLKGVEGLKSRLTLQAIGVISGQRTPLRLVPASPRQPRGFSGMLETGHPLEAPCNPPPNY